jgi:segregation and condensation protein B
MSKKSRRRKSSKPSAPDRGRSTANSAAKSAASSAGKNAERDRSSKSRSKKKRSVEGSKKSRPEAVAAEAEAAQPEAREDEDDLVRVLWAMLFASHEPLPLQRLTRALGLVAKDRVAEGLQQLREQLDEQRAPMMVAEIAGGFRLMTRPEYAPYLARLFHKADKDRLSPASLETLAIVAYRQPATRADVESIRGVQAGPSLRTLQERRLIKVVGRAAVVGRPIQYGTTKRFLDHFGLKSVEDLPGILGGRVDSATGSDGAAGLSAGPVAQGAEQHLNGGSTNGEAAPASVDGEDPQGLAEAFPQRPDSDPGDDPAPKPEESTPEELVLSDPSAQPEESEALPDEAPEGVEILGPPRSS